MKHRRPLLRNHFGLRALILFALCALPFALAHAQNATATLSGTVEDQNGAVVPGVELSVLNVDTYARRQATTNEAGYFTVPLLPPGRYTVTARREGFARVEIPNVVLNVGDQKAIQIQLKTGDVNATVTIDSSVEAIKTDAAVGTVVNRQFVENIPLNGRSFQSLITLTPGVVLIQGTAAAGTQSGQFSVNGQRGSSNAFTVDGVSANFGNAPTVQPGAQTSGNTPGLTTFGTTQSLASVDSVQEFKVQTSSYSAEYGRQPGGQISIVTRSGTNAFQGTVFDYVRNDVFDANDWFANSRSDPKPPMRQNDFGGTFSGPVFLPNIGEGGPGWYNGRNRTFFFFSYEGLRLMQPTSTLTNVPSLSLRQQAPPSVQPILNSFPLPNGRILANGLAEFSASYSNSSTLNATSIRIDHTFNSKANLFARYNQAPSSNNTRSTFNLSQRTLSGLQTKTLTAGVTAIFTSKLLNEFKVNYSDNSGEINIALDSFGGAIPVPRNVIIPSQYDSERAQGGSTLRFTGLTANEPSIGFLDRGVNSQFLFNIVDNVSYALGSHQLKFGVDYRRVSPRRDLNRILLSPTFSSAAQVLNGTASSVTIQASSPAEPIFTNFSAFGQDTWKVSPGLTFSVGLRWDFNLLPDEANGNLPVAVTQISNLSTMRLAPRGAPLWTNSYNNLAPRFGIAYLIRQDPGSETVFRGGFGIFYDTGNDTSGSQFAAFPFFEQRSVSTVPFPLNPVQVSPPLVPILQPSFTTPYGFLNVIDPALRLPYTLQWNTAVEQSIGKSQTFTVSYVGATGKRLLQRRQINMAAINPLFTTVTLTTNTASSEYHALQTQLQRRLSRGLQALASYTWSHAIDDDSFSNASRPPRRGNASFDIRHNFSAAVTYDIPFPKVSRLNAVFNDWAFDTTMHVQSAFPVDIVGSVFTDPLTGDVTNVRPNLVLGVPLYIDDPASPGGLRINRAAFSAPPAGQSGNLGRNVVRGLSIWQVDFALRRSFKLTEKVNVQVRAEAFNLFNHPNFGAIQTNLTSPNFGQATNMLNRQLGGVSQLYQIGGPRSLQFALKLHF